MVSLVLARYRDLERRGRDQGQALVLAAPIGHVGLDAPSKVNVGAKFPTCLSLIWNVVTVNRLRTLTPLTSSTTIWKRS